MAYKNIKTKIKRGLYRAGGTILIAGLLATGALAQEGAIDDKVNNELTPPASAIEETEKNPYKELSDEINLEFNKYRENLFKIGKWEGHKEERDGKTLYFVDGFDYAFLELEIRSDEAPGFASCANYALENKIREAVSAIKYNKEDALFFWLSMKKKDEGVYTVCVKTSIKNKE